MKYSIHISSLFCGGGGGMLVVEGLTKRFSNGKGIEDVTFTVNKGEVFGFLGPNGAGKSTTIRHIMGFMKPDQGHAVSMGLMYGRHKGQSRSILATYPVKLTFLMG